MYSSLNPVLLSPHPVLNDHFRTIVIPHNVNITLAKLITFPNIITRTNKPLSGKDTFVTLFAKLHYYRLPLKFNFLPLDFFYQKPKTRCRSCARARARGPTPRTLLIANKYSRRSTKCIRFPRRLSRRTNGSRTRKRELPRNLRKIS